MQPHFGALAKRIEAAATWDDLVLPEPQLRILSDIAVQARQRATMYDTWGVGATNSRGLGLSILFRGANDTGTLAAEVLANELHEDLYRIDLNRVVSKYIGETEKNLSRVFDAAEQGKGKVILLFDEADALFGKHGQPVHSHDRYSNIEIVYLLERMELYSGLVILMMDPSEPLDIVFLRRIRFVVSFPPPER